MAGLPTLLEIVMGKPQLLILGSLALLIKIMATLLLMRITSLEDPLFLKALVSAGVANATLLFCFIGLTK